MLLTIALLFFGASAFVIDYYDTVDGCSTGASSLFSIGGELGACYRLYDGINANCTNLEACSGLEYEPFMACLGAREIAGSVMVDAETTRTWSNLACDGAASLVIEHFGCPIGYGQICTGTHTNLAQVLAGNLASPAAALASPL